MKKKGLYIVPVDNFDSSLGISASSPKHDSQLNSFPRTGSNHRKSSLSPPSLLLVGFLALSKTPVAQDLWQVRLQSYYIMTSLGATR